MEIVRQPHDEELILISVEEEATADEVYDSLIAKAECCVDSKCGCAD